MIEKYYVNTSAYNAIIFMLVSIIFLSLKITSIITWPWLWVLSPLWMVGGLIAGIWILLSCKHILS